MTGNTSTFFNFLFCFTGDDLVLRRDVLAESLAEYNAIVTFMAGERDRERARVSG